MLRKITQACVVYTERFIPDPFVYVILLTGLTFAAAYMLTASGTAQILDAWYGGIWAILTFAMQMALILTTGIALADAPPVKKALRALARLPARQESAAILVFLVAAFSSWLNWGFGLVVGALLAREIAKRLDDVDFGFLVASAYMGYMTWASGLSSSIALATATHGSSLNIVEKYTGHVAGFSQTVFAPFNLVPLILLVIVMPVLLFHMAPVGAARKTVNRTLLLEADGETETPGGAKGCIFALENARVLTLVLVFMGAAYEWRHVRTGGFVLDFNTFIFMALLLGLLLHQRPIRYVRSFNAAARTVGPILLQYPFYGGIMGMMTGTGLAAIIAQSFVRISTQHTLPFWTFMGSNIITLFVPSGGGHWAVQGPFMIPAALKLHVDPAMVAMATAMGEQTANMVQPFWALPLLALARLGIRDIMGYCIIGLVTGLLLFGGSMLVFA